MVDETADGEAEAVALEGYDPQRVKDHAECVVLNAGPDASSPTTPFGDGLVPPVAEEVSRTPTRLETPYDAFVVLDGALLNGSLQHGWHRS
jgi:hypothetical protein